MESLDNLNKKQLLELIYSLIDDKVINEQDINDRLGNHDMSLEELEVVQKLNNHEELSNAEQKLIEERYAKYENRKVFSLQCGKDKFIKAIVNYNIATYFNAIWKIYPRKIGKELGKKAFTKLVSECKLKELKTYATNIYKRVQWYVNTCEENETEEQYILHFSTFCNSKKYL